MGSLTKIALVIGGVSFMTFVTFFGRLPALRRTPIAWLYRLIWVYIPNWSLALDQRLTSGKLTSSIARFTNYMLYDKHPTVLIFFFLLLSVSEYLYLPAVWPQLSTFHKSAGTVAIILPYVFLYLAAYSDPGVIDSTNHAEAIALYPFDFTLFYPSSQCRTCQFPKPARSKHCSVCKRCISKSDHHCIFINNCVGANNQRWFILLLLTTGILTVYGASLGLSIMIAKIRARYPGWAVWPGRANGGAGMTLKQYLILWSWGLQGNVGMGSVTMLTILTSPMVWGFLVYHLWLVYCGTTTNESLKWSDLQADMDDGLVFKRKLPRDRVKHAYIEPSRTRWPVEAEQTVVRTDDGKPPPQGANLPGMGEWEPVWRLRDVENLYDLGFWDNLVDILLPEHHFREEEEEEEAAPLARRRILRKRRKARY